MKKKLEVIFTIDIEMSDKQVENNLYDYRMLVNGCGDIQDMFEQVAYSVALQEKDCEGVGRNKEDYNAEINNIEVEEF